MPFKLEQYGFDLSNREIALLSYLAIIFVVLAFWKGGHKSLLAVIRAFFAPKLAVVWAVMTLYVGTCVCLLAWLNLWAWPNLKSTLLWWLTVGFVSIFEAQRLKERPDTFRKLVLVSFTITTVLVFIVELVSFPLWVELLMLPALVFLTLLIAVAELKPEHASVLNLFRVVQVLSGLLIFGFSLALVVERVEEFWSLNMFREFALPLLLWLLFVPFIYLLAVLMAYEESFVILRLRPQSVPIVRYARWRALLAFGFDIDAVKRLSRDLRIWNVTDKAGVQSAVREIKRLQKRQRHPPRVDLADGWSPYAAQLFLKEHGIVTGDYHRAPWGWKATSPVVKLNDKSLADSVSYTFNGNEHAVTELYLSLDGWKNDEERQSQPAFDVRALTLLAKVFDAGRAQQIFARAISQTPKAIKVDSVTVQYKSEEWGDGKIRSFCRKLIVEHPRHASMRLESCLGEPRDRRES